MLKHILAKDGEHLCLEKIDEKGERRYEFGDFVPQGGLRHDLLGSHRVRRSPPRPSSSRRRERGGSHQARARPQKGTARQATWRDADRQGVSVLPRHRRVRPGLRDRVPLRAPQGRIRQTETQMFDITERATARVERKLCDEGTRRSSLLKAISSAELTQLLASGGAVEGIEYFEGPKGFVLALGISQAFARLKKSEAKAS